MPQLLRRRVQAQAMSMNFLNELGHSLRESAFSYILSTTVACTFPEQGYSQRLCWDQNQKYYRLKFLQLKKEKEGLEYSHSRTATCNSQKIWSMTSKADLCHREQQKMEQEEMEKNSQLETSVSLRNWFTRVKIGHYGAYGTAACMVYSRLLKPSRGK